MATVTYTIPNNKVAKLVLAVKRFFPNIEKNSDGSAKYTDEQWVKEVGTRFFLDMVRRYDHEAAAIAAVNAVVPDELIS